MADGFEATADAFAEKIAAEGNFTVTRIGSERHGDELLFRYARHSTRPVRTSVNSLTVLIDARTGLPELIFHA